jgi:FkbM family methyltransferase
MQTRETGAPHAFTPDERRRIELTTAVRDTDALPKVDNAGAIETRNGQRVQVMHNGVVVEEDCYNGAWTTEIIRRLRGHHEPQEEMAFAALLERLGTDTTAPTMIELGSFWAYYSLWAKAADPATRSICVEPDPHNLEVGRRNFALNGYDGRFIQAAVGVPHGEHIRIRTESDNALRSVPLVTLDGLMCDEGLDRVDLLLCDTQGAELGLLTDARETLRSGRVRFLVVSTHHHSISGDPLTHQRCLAVLRDCGAHIIAEHSVLESCSGDGLIAASMDPRDADLEVHVSVVRSRDTIFGEPEYELERALRHSPRRAARRVAKRTVQTVLRRVDAVRGHSEGK